MFVVIRDGSSAQSRNRMNGKSSDNDANLNDEFFKGARVVITKADRGAVRTAEFVGKEGVIREMPGILYCSIFVNHFCSR